jgi:hypothetical protein
VISIGSKTPVTTEQQDRKPHLLIEYPIPLIDIRDVALVFVKSFARELAFLVDTVDMRFES